MSKENDGGNEGAIEQLSTYIWKEAVSLAMEMGFDTQRMLSLSDAYMRSTGRDPSMAVCRKPVHDRFFVSLIGESIQRGLIKAWCNRCSTEEKVERDRYLKSVANTAGKLKRLLQQEEGAARLKYAGADLNIVDMIEQLKKMEKLHFHDYHNADQWTEIDDSVDADEIMETDFNQSLRELNCWLENDQEWPLIRDEWLVEKLKIRKTPEHFFVCAEILQTIALPINFDPTSSSSRDGKFLISTIQRVLQILENAEGFPIPDDGYEGRGLSRSIAKYLSARFAVIRIAEKLDI